MPTKLPLTAAMLLFSSLANAADFVEIIDNQNYAELKATLYTEQPNALSREKGFSILDYAIAKKDKRAAIIIADYNNSSLSKRRLKLIEIEILNLSSAMKEASSNTDIEEQIAALELERKALQKQISDATATKVDAKLKQIDPDLKSLQEKVAALEAAQKEPKEAPYIDDIATLTAKVNNMKPAYSSDEIASLIDKVNLLETSLPSEDVAALTEKVNSMQTAYTTEEIAELIAKVDTLEKSNKEQIESIKLEIANTVISLKALRDGGENQAELDALIDGLELRVKSLEGKVMPVELKNATFNSRDIFKESISL
ncbi:hypothetical protein OTK49_00430 [Vibrio coralliirubri]|uniref:hypothetical protein n=1 Tax=Vibrio coralliirubri TaxID=1516159 RepID=UPI0022843DF8|nr:hypothetical protein [Vibrio coralliirubri]MCY9861007.1 hypothetical protein [Vibrio coralliirubri]